jgi:hypothetical protein
MSTSVPASSEMICSLPWPMGNPGRQARRRTRSVLRRNCARAASLATDHVQRRREARDLVRQQAGAEDAREAVGDHEGPQTPRAIG